MSSQALLTVTCLILAGLSSACTHLTRSTESGYSYQDGPYSKSNSGASQFYDERLSLRESESREELGFHEYQSLSEGQNQAVKQRIQLKSMERRLGTQTEKKQYYKYKGQMKNDQERMTFLSIPSTQARERWAMQRGLVEPEGFEGEIADLIEKNDIAIGMSEKAVVQSWGDPDLVEVAGDPVYGNQRWRYSRYVSATDGFDKKTRIIYFESGRVVGWETL